MTACPDKEALLQAWVDGELDAANAVALEGHIKTCAGCAGELSRLRTLRRAFSGSEVRHETPPGLRDRILAQIAESEEPSIAPRVTLRRRGGLAGWAMGGVGGAIAAGLAALAIVPLLGPSLQDELIADHVRSTLASHLTDVATSNQHVVRPWFNGRIDFSPPVVDLIDQGFPLVGGRLDYVDRQVVAALVYRRRLHVINLFVWPQGRAGRHASSIAGHDGYSLEHWRANGLEYWAVSDVDKSDLDGFHRAYAARTAGR